MYLVSTFPSGNFWGIAMPNRVLFFEGILSPFTSQTLRLTFIDLTSMRVNDHSILFSSRAQGLLSSIISPDRSS